MRRYNHELKRTEFFDIKGFYAGGDCWTGRFGG